MKFLKQASSFSIMNLDKLVKTQSHSDSFKKHGELLPNSIRALIVGPSNCGKTNLMLNLLFSPQGLFFENIYIFSKSLFQNKYKFLEKVLEKIDEVGYYAFSDNDEVPPPNEVKPASIMIFDDVAFGKQTNIKNYFSMGRHSDVDTFYICQTYSYIPKQLVRDNANLIIAFSQDDRNLRHIYNDHVNSDMKFDKFKEMCLQVWKNGKNSFLVINKDCDTDNGRYRSGFDTFIKL